MGNYVSYVERASKLYVKDILAKIPGVKVEKIDVNPQLLLQDLLEFHIQLSFEKKDYYCVMNAMTWKVKGYDNPYMLAMSFSSFYEGTKKSLAGFILTHSQENRMLKHWELNLKTRMSSTNSLERGISTLLVQRMENTI